MLALAPGGRERTEQQLAELGRRAGLTLRRTVALASADFAHVFTRWAGRTGVDPGLLARTPTGGWKGGAVHDLPSGTVTFLFTDLGSSTRLWEQHPADMQTALARHDALLTEAVHAHGGQIVKTTGDGLHAVFATADAALAAALDGQHALERESWGPTGALRVRMGLHTGVAEERAGDYYGPSLNRAARLMGLAHPGQVLC